MDDRRRCFPGLTWILCLLLTGCPAPAVRLDHQAQALGFARLRLTGQTFDHLVYVKGRPCSNGRLHVYLEGDGNAWLPGNRVAADPTPAHSCLLPLMARDPAPAVYLGRPCYHGLAATAGCHPLLWTQARYSDAVVTSMITALGRIIGDRHCLPILIGYSGGGALAMLMAARLPRTITGVVTLAGNLNVTAWTRLHHYSPLQGSLDPAGQPPLPKSIFQIHIAGERDDNIPVVLIRKEASRQPNARFFALPGRSHACPREAIWSGILTSLTVLETGPGPAENPSDVRPKR